MFAKIALLSPPFQTYSYVLPSAFPLSFWQIGQRVAMPVGKSLRIGVIAALEENSGLPPGATCRTICWPLETGALPGPQIMDLARDLALRQGISPGFILGHVLPQGLRSLSVNLLIHDKGAKKAFSLQQIAALPPQKFQNLASALLSGSARLIKSSHDAADLEMCSLAVDPPWPLRPAAKRQIALMDYLYEHGRVSRRRLTVALGADAGQALRSLTAKGLIRIAFDEPEDTSAILAPPPEQDFTLNEDQQAALRNLVQAVNSGSPQNRLLHGVTGSGKTAVYLALARHCLTAGKSVFLLAPEVALAHKLYNDARQSLPDMPNFLYHGYQTPARRESIFRQLANTEKPVIVVGTRSALFLPVPNPGCVILDEEHDASYKQDEVFVYHAKEVAWYRMHEACGLLVLGSATPDIRTYHAAKTGILPMLELPKRASGRELPPVELVRLGARAGIGEDAAGLLAPECEEALTETARAGEQAVILLNRRGYAPLIYCLGCEQTIHCPHCQIGMAYHKGIGRLVCHYCGYNIPWPSACPSCGGNSFTAIGEGTERLAERLEALAGQTILRLDRDSARRAGKIDEILTAFAAGQSPFLVGTQMLSKGHHFPNVTLVVVADGDIGLNLPDYRAAERTFQLLVQAAGRAGRGAKPGRALIQTRNPDHYCWRHIIKYDYEGFFADELALRKKHHYPPFVKLGLLRLSCPAADDEAREACQKLGPELRRKARETGTVLLGPTPAPMFTLKGRKRFHCLLKADRWDPMRELWAYAEKSKTRKDMRIELDMDPVDML